MPNYTIKQGDHLSALADQFGFFELESIWDHPNNAALKAKRKDPHILFPGDELFIPAKADKTAPAPTTKINTFKVKKQPLKIKLLLQDVNGKPLANVDCKLDIEGTVTSEKTGGDGTITKTISRSAKVGKLSLTHLDVPLLIGHLDPVEEDSGQVARLNNLGYEAGDLGKSDPDRFKSAVEEFQCDNSLNVDGICGSGTQAKLKQVHGC
jgi:hypothetical protein